MYKMFVNNRYLLKLLRVNFLLTDSTLFWIYSRTPVTQTLKGNEKQFELARVRVTKRDCKIQFLVIKINLFYQKR